MEKRHLVHILQAMMTTRETDTYESLGMRPCHIFTITFFSGFSPLFFLAMHTSILSLYHDQTHIVLWQSSYGLPCQCEREQSGRRKTGEVS